MKFTRLHTSAEVKDLLQFHNENSQSIVLDVETTSKDARDAKLIDVQISGKQEDEAVIFSAEKAPLLTDLLKSLVIVAHNYRYDAHVLFLHNVDLLSHTWRDTLLIGHLLDENRESYSLDSYVKEYWNDPYKEEFWSKYKSYGEASEEDRINYACRDVCYTERLYKQMLLDCDSGGLPATLIEHSARLQSALLQTEIAGIRVDTDYLQDLGVKLKARLDDLRPQMRSLVKDEVEILELEAWQKKIATYKTDKGKASVPRPSFSFDSASQLQRLLYSSLGLPVQRNEKTKSISTDYTSLERIKGEHPVIELIQENREVQKVYTAYVMGTLERMDQGRIYPQFRVAGTVTGRISHSNPNLAQLPKSGGVRGIYVPEPGWVLFAADYSQLEVVLEANLTGDKNLIRMLENGDSKHDLTARELGCDRDLAKTLNFASQYHCSHYKIAKLAGVSVAEGMRIWKRYWEIYSGPKSLKDQTDEEIDAGLPLVTCYGRKRRFPVMKRPNWHSDYRQGYNFKIQSPGADFMSEAFYLADDELRRRGVGKMLWTIHDEGVGTACQAYGDEAESVLVAAMESMAGKYKLAIPLRAQKSGPMLRWED